MEPVHSPSPLPRPHLYLLHHFFNRLNTIIENSELIKVRLSLIDNCLLFQQVDNIFINDDTIGFQVSTLLRLAPIKIPNLIGN